MKNTKALAVLEEVAASLKESAETANVNSSFDEGRLTGYYEALSTLVSQCDIAGVELSEIGLAGFSLESILRGAPEGAKTMAKPNDYASLLYTLLLKARETGERNPGSGEAFACYQIIDTAMTEAEAYGISLNEIGLEGFDPETLLAAN